MTTGIYCLEFDGTDKVYIGQSINIERRIKEHYASFKTCTASKTLQYAYDTFGLPKLNILCECTVAELSKTEEEAIEIFDAINNGFNSIKYCGLTKGVYGENHNRAKYSNNQIKQVFHLLLIPNILFIDINKQTGVSIDVIRSISSSKTHVWLEEEFPEKYKILRSLKGSRRGSNNINIIHPKVINSNGEIFNIDNICRFAKEHKLDQSNLTALLKGRAKSHKGWKLA